MKLSEKKPLNLKADLQFAASQYGLQKSRLQFDDL
jgi:hypothetical protein